MYDCNDFDDNSSWLEIDLSIDCNGRAHKMMMVYGYFIGVLWIVGAPLLYIYVLGSHSLTFARIFAIEKEIEEQDQLGSALRKEVAEAIEHEADDKKMLADAPKLREQDVPLGFKWRLLGPRQPVTYLGTQWVVVGHSKPTTGVEFKNDQLSAALLAMARAKTDAGEDLTQAPFVLSSEGTLSGDITEWAEHFLEWGLHANHFVRVVELGIYFKPVPASAVIHNAELETMLMAGVLKHHHHQGPNILGSHEWCELHTKTG